MGNKEVEEEKFWEFVNNYPEPLERDVCYIVEPPAVNFNIIRDGKAYPVAFFYDDYLDANKRHYFIKKETQNGKTQ